MPASPRIALLLIGNELLSGRTLDKNMAFVGSTLVERGLRLSEARVVPDSAEVIISTLNALRAQYDQVFTTGGIGPTHDDITAQCVADAFGAPLERNAEAVAILEAFYGERLNEARLRMANIPCGARLIPNPVSAAPGFTLENVHVMAGVPKIMQAMFLHEVAELGEGPKQLFRNLRVNLPEGDFAPALAAIQAEYPDVEIGSYPYMNGPELGANLVFRATEATILQRATEATVTQLRALGASAIDET